jgi:hypothetical protein
LLGGAFLHDRAGASLLLRRSKNHGFDGERFCPTPRAIVGCDSGVRKAWRRSHGPPLRDTQQITIILELQQF